MKFTIESNILQKCINIVDKSIPAKSTVPIIENMYLETTDNELILRGNNLEISIEYKITLPEPAVAGKILVKAKTLSDIISKLQNQKLIISKDATNKLHIQSDTVSFDILGLSIEEYPHFPDIEQGLKIKLASKDIKQLIKYTLFAVSFDDTKQFLNGVLIKIEDEDIKFVATDGYRLALKSNFISPQEKNISVIIPYKALNELNKIMQIMEFDSDIELSISNNQISFLMPNFKLISRLIQGNFPNYNQVLPQSTLNQVTLSRRSLMQASERASIIASESNDVVRLTFESTKLLINANAPKLGEFNQSLDLSREFGNEVIKIAFNINLIMDALKNMEADDISLKFNTSLSPCVLQAVNDESFIYIIMPIKTSDYVDVEIVEANA